jgi:phosphoglycerol transferase MdoB-like AlkP superfamily enzyme
MESPERAVTDPVPTECPPAVEAPRQRRLPRRVARVAVTLTLCCLLAILTEYLHHRGTSLSCVRWLKTFSGPATTTLLIYSIIGFFAALTRRRVVVWTFWTLVFCGLAVISNAKMLMLNEPLVPADTAYLGQMMALLEDTLRWYHALLLLPMLGLFGAAAWVDHRWPMRWSWRQQLGSMALFAIFPTLVFLSPKIGVFSWVTPSAAKREAFAGRYRVRFNRDGYLISTATILFEWAEKMPFPGYTRERVVETAQGVASQFRDSTTPAAPIGERPHVIIMMSEALFDVTQFPRVSFSPDPLEHLHAALKEFGPRSIVSPTVGGMTCNVEFELLTGMVMRNVASDIVPYSRVVRSELPGLPRVFKEHGYSCLAVHPYRRNFWSRNIIYPKLGFDRFDGVETFAGASKVGRYVSDDEVVSRIIKELEGSSAPTFLFAITMQNHAPYSEGLYAQYDVSMKHELPDDRGALLQDYAQGIHYSDRAIGRLMEYVRSSKHPTILVVFGDHMPAFVRSFADTKGSEQLLKAAGYLTSSGERLSLEDEVKDRGTPLLIAQNFPTAYHLPLDRMSPAFLAPDILRLAGIEHPFYTGFLDRLRRKAPALVRQVCLDEQGKPQANVPAAAQEMAKEYELLQHDMLWGEQYAWPILFSAPGSQAHP